MDALKGLFYCGRGKNGKPTIISLSAFDQQSYLFLPNSFGYKVYLSQQVHVRSLLLMI